MTRAEYHAWGWGLRMADTDMDIVTALFPQRADPADLLNDDERAAFERMGPQRFWTWAMTGFNARADEDLPER